MSSIKTTRFTDEETKELRKVYTSFKKFGQSYIRTEPGNVVLPVAYNQYKDRLYNFKTRVDDVFVLSFPKTGTTWTQEMVWCVLNDGDVSKAKSIPQFLRSPVLEIRALSDIIPKNAVFLKDDEQNGSDNSDVFKYLEEDLPSPRVIKSHLQFCLLPDDLLERCKSVICLRNPKDTVVSYFHHEQLMNIHGYEGDFATYFDLFMKDQCIYSPYFESIVDLWQKRNHSNVCLLFYEEMKKDLPAAIWKVAKFLGKVPTEEQVESMIDHLGFKSMKQSWTPIENSLKESGMFERKGDFLRKGEIGDWKNYFTDEMNKRMDEAIEKHFIPVGLKFIYEI